METLLSMCSSTPIEFGTEALAILNGPGVYVYVENDRAIYVGMAKRAIGRSLSAQHAHRDEFQSRPGTSLIIFPCRDVAAARALEEKLIGELNPELNKVGGYVEAARRLGFVSTTSMRLVYRTKRRNAA